MTYPAPVEVEGFEFTAPALEPDFEDDDDNGRPIISWAGYLARRASGRRSERYDMWYDPSPAVLAEAERLRARGKVAQVPMSMRGAATKFLKFMGMGFIPRGWSEPPPGNFGRKPARDEATPPSPLAGMSFEAIARLPEIRALLGAVASTDMDTPAPSPRGPRRRAREATATEIVDQELSELADLDIEE